jgi:hypothetical protein
MKLEITIALILTIASTCMGAGITKSNRHFYRQKTDGHGNNAKTKTIEHSTKRVTTIETNVFTNALGNISTNITRKSRIER